MNTAFMQRMNPAQREAVISKAQVEQILAGPGSGKTRVLTSRVAWLVLHEHADPARMVVVTFTNKAAREMRERLESPELLGRLRSDQLLMGTFHGLCARLLRNHGGLVNVKNNFSIADNDVSMHVIKKLLGELKGTISEYGRKNTKPERFYNEISRAKNSGKTLEQYIAENGQNFQKKDYCIMFRAYEERLRVENLIDFDNLIIFGRELVMRFPHVVDFVTHILVDEFQDTNVVQYDFVKYLTGANKSLTVVGDPDQSIFGWRCADRENFHRLVKDYPQCDVKNLEENYRSTKSILAGATHVINIDQGRIPKSLFTGNQDGAPISYLRFSSDEMEASSVAEEIRRVVDHSNGLINYKDIAILVRMNFMSRNIEQSLTRMGIPYVVVGGVKFFERAEVKDIISYVRFFHNTNDTEAFERIINKPKRGIGATNLNKMAALSRQRDWNVIRVLRAVVEPKSNVGFSMPKKTKEGIKEFLRLYADYKDLVQRKKPISVILQYIIDAIDYKNFLAAQHPDKDGESRWGNVGELVTFAKAGFDGLSGGKSTLPVVDGVGVRDELEDRLASEKLGRTDPVAAFLEATSLSSTIYEEEEAAKGKVTITTMHSSKGLEWPCVFAVGLESGIIPHSRAEDKMEECRLLYVAMTRAKCFLYITHALERTSWGSSNPSTVTSFLEKFPEDGCTHSTPTWNAETRKWVGDVLRIPLPDESTAKDSEGSVLWAEDEMSSSRWGGRYDDYDDFNYADFADEDDELCASEFPNTAITTMTGASAALPANSQPYSSFMSATRVKEHTQPSKRSIGFGSSALGAKRSKTGLGFTHTPKK